MLHIAGIRCMRQQMPTIRDNARPESTAPTIVNANIPSLSSGGVTWFTKMGKNKSLIIYQFKLIIFNFVLYILADDGSIFQN